MNTWVEYCMTRPFDLGEYEFGPDTELTIDLALLDDYIPHDELEVRYTGEWGDTGPVFSVKNAEENAPSYLEISEETLEQGRELGHVIVDEPKPPAGTHTGVQHLYEALIGPDATKIETDIVIEDGNSEDESQCEDISDEDDTGDGRKVPVDPSSGDLRPTEFHRQDWLLIAEALIKVTQGYYMFTNFLEDRAEYAQELVPAVVAEAGVFNEDIRKHIDYWWDGSKPAEPEDTRPDYEQDGIESLFIVSPSEVDRTVDSFTSLDWIVIAEALNAFRADLHLAGPGKVPRGSDRDVELKNAAVRAAGYEDVDNILPIARRLYSEANEK